MQFCFITDRQQALTAFTDLRRSFAAGAVAFPNHKVGWPSGSGQFDVYWHQDLRIWGLFEPKPPKSEGRRFWICFGVNDPEKTAMLSITVETNPPHQGVDRFVGGAFLKDNQDQAYLAHSGKVGGGRQGVGPSAFLSFYRGGERAFVPERNAEMIILGRVDAPELTKNLAAYAEEVARFKEQVKATTSRRR